MQYKADAAPQHLQSQETAEGRWSLTLGSGFLVITTIQDQSLSSSIFPTLLISGCPLQICSFDAKSISDKLTLTFVLILDLKWPP